MSVRILEGDCRAILPTLPDASVQCVVTSPPYFGLRDYGTAQWEGGDSACDHKGEPIRTREHINANWDGSNDIKNAETRRPMGQVCDKCGARRIDQQIGLESSVDAYVAELVGVFREVRRVLRDDGTVFLNLGDSYWSGGVQRGAACDTPDREPEDSLGRGCLCGSLCDACRVAYRTGRVHSAQQHAPMRAPSLSATSRERTGFGFGHLPTSDLPDQGDRTAVAIEGLARAPLRAGEPLRVSQESMTDESSQPLLGAHSRTANHGVCLLCACSLGDCAQAFAGTRACTCGIDSPLDASDRRRLGKSSSGLAYLDSTTTFLKPKDLIGVPWRVAFALQADGWYLRSDIIWHKPNPMPESVRDRPTKSHEYVFLLSKQARYFWDAEAVKEDAKFGEHHAKYNSVASGNRYNNRNEHNRDICGANDGLRGGLVDTSGRNIRSVWTIATAPFSEAHFATFPPDLVIPCIKAGTSERGACAACGTPWVRVVEQGSTVRQTFAGSNGQQERPAGVSHTLVPIRRDTVGWQPSCACDAGDPVPQTVLDPFAGAGTTGLVADRLGRDAILIELSPTYSRMARERIRGDAPLFADVDVS